MRAMATTYDELPYESNPYLWTHPDRLATTALLFGMDPPPPDRCRVLELGCASGGNLIPMALELPNSSFVGIDLSQRQIDDGQKIIAALGPKNIELKALSILDAGAELGPFDYIVSHGVYSWVPAEVQDKMLEICAQNLTPNGVAYISYNTYPGWYMRRMIRDILYYHARQFADARERVRQARALLEFLAQSVFVREGSVYPSLLKGAAEVFRKQSDTYLLHEYLEEVNEPVFFHEFVERAAAKGLQYVADAKLTVTLPGTYTPAVEHTLQQLAADRLHREQYLDFLYNQAFRRALLCRSHVTVSEEPRSDRLDSLQVGSPAQPVSPKPDIFSTMPESFRRGDGVTPSVRDPLLKAALLQLAEVWPRTMAFEALLDAARSRLGQVPAADAQTLRAALWNGYVAELVELRLGPPPCVPATSACPVASPLARYQAETASRVTTLRHEVVDLNPLDRQLVRLLDGTRDRAALVEAVTELVVTGVLVVTQPDGVVLTDAARVRGVVNSTLENHLGMLARWSLLVG
jgi:methyltransferase-like protein/SAM-dependent methyltransferase